MTAAVPWHRHAVAQAGGIMPKVPSTSPSYVAGQVGGYVEVYDGLTFSTVRNAGHMVPYTQAERAYYLFAHWIHGKSL